jgi:hypothetical protein
MNESVVEEAEAILPPLKTLEDILHNRIIHKKREVHKSHNRVYTDNLWNEIDTQMGIIKES